MARKKQFREPEPLFKIGDRVTFLVGVGSTAIGRIVEDRGCLGVGGRRIYGIKYYWLPGELRYTEVPEVELTAAPQGQSPRERFRRPPKGRFGQLYCKTCKEELFLGEWLRSRNGPAGLWHEELSPYGDPCAPLLGRKVLRFLARHMDHELIVGSDGGGLADALIASGQYRSVDDEYDELATREEGAAG